MNSSLKTKFKTIFRSGKKRPRTDLAEGTSAAGASAKRSHLDPSTSTDCVAAEKSHVDLTDTSGVNLDLESETCHAGRGILKATDSTKDISEIPSIDVNAESGSNVMVPRDGNDLINIRGSDNVEFSQIDRSVYRNLESPSSSPLNFAKILCKFGAVSKKEAAQLQGNKLAKIKPLYETRSFLYVDPDQRSSQQTQTDIYMNQIFVSPLNEKDDNETPSSPLNTGPAFVIVSLAPPKEHERQCEEVPESMNNDLLSEDLQAMPKRESQIESSQTQSTPKVNDVESDKLVLESNQKNSEPILNDQIKEVQETKNEDNTPELDSRSCLEDTRESAAGPVVSASPVIVETMADGRISTTVEVSIEKDIDLSEKAGLCVSEEVDTSLGFDPSSQSTDRQCASLGGTVEDDDDVNEVLNECWKVGKLEETINHGVNKALSEERQMEAESSQGEAESHNTVKMNKLQAFLGEEGGTTLDQQKVSDVTGLVDAFCVETRLANANDGLNRGFKRFRTSQRKVRHLISYLDQLKRESLELTRLLTMTDQQTQALHAELQQVKAGLAAVSDVAVSLSTECQAQKLEPTCYRRYLNARTASDAANVLTAIRSRQKALSELEVLVYRKQLVLQHALPVAVQDKTLSVKKPVRLSGKKAKTTEGAKLVPGSTTIPCITSLAPCSTATTIPGSTSAIPSSTAAVPAGSTLIVTTSSDEGKAITLEIVAASSGVDEPTGSMGWLGESRSSSDVSSPSLCSLTHMVV